MPLSRPSLAFAGSAALLVVAGIVSHQVLMTPHSPTLPMPGLASEDATPTIAEQVAAPPQAASAESPVGVAKRAAPGPSQPPQAAPTLSAAAPDRTAAARAEAHDAERLWAEQAARARSTEAYSEHLQTYPDGLAANVAKSRGTIAHDGPPFRYHSQGRDRFTDFTPNPVKLVTEEPVSTFSIDVDTASYAYARAALNDGWLPESDAVRTEELVNYFPYDYAPPETRDPPFATHVSVMPAPWNDAARLLHIGIKGHVPTEVAAPPANLVFLVDTSGSMDEPNKLPLLVRSLKLLHDRACARGPSRDCGLCGHGRGGAGADARWLSGSKILASLERLYAGGSTAGAEGIREAYRLAGLHFIEGGVNRVILATDGDFNVGISNPDVLEDYIARKRSSGIALSVLGFGMGNYNDALMQRLAQHGDGNAAYIDSLAEARKVLLEEAASTLVTIAKDVKIQVEFNPSMVSEYRLIGYETRLLAREDFRNDKVDAGEIGAGHTVTAIYELIPAGSDATRVPSLRYKAGEATPASAFDGELAFLKLRYKLPDAETSTLMTRAVTVADAFASVDDAPRDVRFAAAVAAFGELLRGGRHIGDYGYDDIVTLAQGARGDDPFGYRNEFVRLVRLARSIAELEH